MRASELVAAAVEHIIEALDPEARLLEIPRSKTDQEGEGATAYLSPRSVRAITAWQAASEIVAGPVFQQVQIRRYTARKAMPGRSIDSISSRVAQDAAQTRSGITDRI